ncbi:hypothetical protein KIW84_045584 [Lathyrus oleraceus]|uniref:Uncharacterized protein n=1 Tax=Pisum sativum TaxID=3888 RepID=A0A9D4XNK5_PEA|nr:hypothetical protein KIW84_045584 [Pisum sativum]
MQAIFGSVRRSLVFRTASPETEDQSLRVGETLVDKTVTASVILDLKRGNWKWNYYWNYPNMIFLREYIGKVQGYILLLVSMSSSEHDQAARDAIELLEKFSYFDQNVIQVVKAKLFQTFIATSLSHSSLKDASHFRISSPVTGVSYCFTGDRRSVTQSW